MWNHSEMVYPRTNNHVEDYHGGPKKTIGSAHPHVYKFIDILKRVESRSVLTYNQIDLGKICISRKDQLSKIDICLENAISNLKCDDDFDKFFFQAVNNVKLIKEKSSLSK